MLLNENALGNNGRIKKDRSVLVRPGCMAEKNWGEGGQLY